MTKTTAKKETITNNNPISTKIKKVGRDKYGWINGSKSGARWAMFLKGASKADVIKELGSGLAPFWRGMRMKDGNNFSRNAKMVTKYIKATKTLKYFIGSYTLPDGSKHTNPKAPSKSTLAPVKKATKEAESMKRIDEALASLR